MPPVLIEMPPPESTTHLEYEAALLEACSEAAEPDDCVRASDADQPPEIFAVVSWTGERSVHISVGRRSGDAWLKRHLTFSDEDPVLERWRATGYAIGTLVGASRQQPAATSGSVDTDDDVAANPPPVLAPETGEDSSVPFEAKSRSGVSAFFLDALFVAGTGPSGSARYGPGLAFGTRMESGLLFRLDAERTFSTSSLPNVPDGPALNTRFWSAGAAIGHFWAPFPSALLEASIGPYIEGVQAALRPGDARDERLVGSVRGVVSFRKQLIASIDGVAAVTSGLRFGETTVALDGDDVSRISPLQAGGLIGLSVNFR